MDDPTQPENAPIATDKTSGKFGRIIDLSRLVGPLAAIGCVLVALAIGSVAVRANHWPTPRWLDPVDPMMENGMQEELSAKVGTLIRSGWGTRGGSKSGLGLLLGSSATRYGFKTSLLEAESNVPMRWMNIGTNGGNADDCYRVGRMVLQSELSPTVIVLGLHQEMLPRTNEYLVDETSLRLDKWKGYLVKGDIRPAFEEFGNLCVAAINRAFPRRRHTTYHFREVAIEAKLKFFHSMGIGVDGLFAPDNNLWRAPTLERAPWATTNNPMDITDTLAVAIKERGFFSEPNYRIDGPNTQAVLRLIEECDRHKIRLIIVLTPQVAKIRKLLPVSSLDCLNKVIEGPVGLRPEVLDLRTAIPEGHFRDVLHVNEEGSEEVSRHLTAYLKKIKN